MQHFILEFPDHLRLCILSICQKLHLMLHKPFIGILPAWYEPDLLCFLVDDGLVLYSELIEQDKQEQIIRTRLDDLVSLCPCCFPIYTEKL